MKIDLQIHTTFSDGTNSPTEMAQLALQGGLNVIAVTDHDRVDGVLASQTACEPLGIKVIPAVEISTKYKEHAIHILGYNIDINNSEFVQFLKSINNIREQKFLEGFPALNEALKREGKKEVDAEKFKGRDAKYYTRSGLVDFLIEEKIIDNRDEGYILAKNVRGTTQTVETVQAILAIHKAGGVAVFSHPLAPKISLKNITPDQVVQESIVKEFKEQGLNGLECYQACHNKDDVELCLAWAEKYNLIITAGSDWHGYYPPEDMGVREYIPYYINALGDLEVPEDKAEQIVKSLV